MKKVLFATTALVMTAGVAAAEVAVSGNGRMGVYYNGADWNFSSRARVAFTLSGQTDGGLDFGASFRADNAGGAAAGDEGSIWISGAFGKIEMGDVVSAPEALFGDLPEVGYTDLGQTVIHPLYGAIGLGNDIPYLTLDNAAPGAGNNASNVLYTYSAGAFSVAASLSDGFEDRDTSVAVDQAYAVAAAYTFGNYTVGLGYENLDVVGAASQSQTELAAVASFGNTSVKAYYAVGGDANPVDDAIGLGVSSTFGATTVMGYVQKATFVGGDDVTWYGLGASYDLGGGASIAGGVMDNDAAGDTVADLGIKFKF